MSEDTLGAKDQIELIFNVAPMGLMLLNQDQEIITANQALLTCLGYEEDELKHTCLIDHCHPLDREPLEKVLRGTGFQEEHTGSAVVRFLTKSGIYIWAELSVGNNLTGQAFRGNSVVVVQDIQARREMQLEVLELRHRLNVQVEQERNQLAQDLHDGPMQDLHSIQYQLSALQSQLPEETSGMIQGALETVSEVSQELRNISYNLRPPALSRFGLAKSIRSHADEFSKNHPEFNLELDLVDDDDLLDEDLRLALFRIYQQALGNILQHSEASEIVVSLQFEDSDIRMLIQDDGKGFKLPKRWISLVREGHYGLAGSHDRVSALGGDFNVKSSPGEGTVLQVYIPNVLEVEGE